MCLSVFRAKCPPIPVMIGMPREMRQTSISAFFDISVVKTLITVLSFPGASYIKMVVPLSLLERSLREKVLGELLTYKAVEKHWKCDSNRADITD